MNKNVSIHLRLKLFSSVVTPTALFGLSTLPLNKSQLQQLDITQRRMLRSIAGWAPLVDGDWAAAMRKTNERVRLALIQFPVEPWTIQLASRQFKFACRMAGDARPWPARSVRWDPLDFDPSSPHLAHRSPGRPRRKWDHYLQLFSNETFPQHLSWIDAAGAEQDWLAMEQECQECFAS